MAKTGIHSQNSQQEVVVGIDLGTSNSLIAVVHPLLRQPVTLREYDRSAVVPSVVYFTEEHHIVVGDRARAKLTTHPRQTVYSTKRLMGRSYEDIREQTMFYSYRISAGQAESVVKIEVNDTSYSPVELSAYILQALKRRAELILKVPVTKAVITVPASFNDAQRQATRDAGKLAGLDVLRIINEPTAAALAFGLGMGKEEKTVAVYDLGGGAFDISILKISNGNFEVLATQGDSSLGGDDLDRVIVDHWAYLHEISQEALGSNKGLAQELRLKAEEAKQALSQTSYFRTRMNNYELQLTREQLDELIQPLIEKTLQHCRLALQDAQLAVKDLAAVIMVGGSTRIPLIKDTVSAFFEQPVNDSLNPDEVVAIGAAIQADMLAGNSPELTLMDVTPLSLGIETMGGLMDVLIPRNTRIPASATRSYTTQQDGQGEMKIAVYQGERELVKDNRKLAEFDLAGIPNMAAGLPQIQVSFLLDADGILTVDAREMGSGAAQHITVQPARGLTGDTAGKMVLAAITHAQEDMETRNLVEIQTAAQQLLDVTTAFLDRNSELLTEQETDNTRQAMDALQEVAATADQEAITEKIEQLNKITLPFAERLTEKALRKAP
ncbi:Fe-S protein assembly chaperone HscA [Chitinophaga agrisoli]|uniref:Fe-S protein assembly chaperone HscA n=1 Tax=Chitinophaga agrisoli TaxID=2607653 RepID=A0A5B2VS27_9BACT|nr:Fe-S protein assembly chaperone HscA [Chitinophaga agrisoli]KAA2241438.1 Fe-S protein assembly chaperone HscA [Chitinophaga agrisoli]